MDDRKTCPICGRRYDAAATFCQKDGTPLKAAPGAVRAPLPEPAYVEAPDPLIGQIVLDQFEIMERIGEGGMGTVYRAHQTTIDRDVAIKVLRSELLENAEAVRRFKREAKVATSLDHPNVVRVYLFGELPDGRFYLVMEHLRGRPMTEVLDRGAVPLSRALHLVIQTAKGIGAAHALGIVHRDVKPENLFVIKRGDDPDFVKVLDFGIARLLWDEQTQATQAGTIFGTARYISPEGAAGEPTDMRSDVYSLGILGYQLLAGRTPFEGDSPVALLMKHIHQPAPDLRETPSGRYVPDAVADVIMRALAKNPDARLDDARAFALALEAAEARAHQGVGARRDETPILPHGIDRPTPVTLGASIPGLRRRRRWPMLVTAFVLGAAAVTAGALTMTRLVVSPPSPPATDITALNARAERALVADHLATPAGENVTELTAQALLAAPRDSTAMELRREASVRLMARARLALEASQLSQARTEAERARVLTPDDATIAALLTQVESREREAALEPGIHFDPEAPVVLQQVAVEAVLPAEAATNSGLTGYFELKHGRLRSLRLGAVRSSARRFVGTHTFRHAGMYVVTFVPSVGERGPSARVAVQRGARRHPSEPPTTTQQASPMNPPAMVVRTPDPPPNDRIDWSAPPPPVNGAPAHMSPTMTPHMSPTMTPHMSPTMTPHMSPTMTPHMSPTMSPFVQPPPVEEPPPPWTG